MKPSRLVHNFLSTFTAIVLGACAGGGHEELRQRIDRVENTMLPAVVVSGIPTTPFTIWELMHRFNVPGVSVAVVNNGTLEWARGYGALEAEGPDVNPETLFLAGQISQAVTAVGALTLVEHGDLGLDDNVNQHLQNWHVPDNESTTSEKVTLRRVLTHTSGLSVGYSLGYQTGDSIPTLLQTLDGHSPATNEPVRVTAEPGSGQQYSLGGYLVLQQMVEDVSGQEYARFIDSTVLSTLGMNRSFHTQPMSEDLVSNAARGHEPTNERVQGRWRIYPEVAALGMWTTPSDLATLAIELQRAYAGQSGLVLSQTLAEEMLTRQFENRGLGVEVGGDGDWRFFRLEGHGNNYLADLFAYVSQGMGAIVMTNSSNGEAVKAHILRAIAAEYGWPDLLPEEVEVVSLSERRLRELEGTYSFRGRDRVLRMEDGRMLQSSEGSPDQELLALSDSLLVSVTFGYRYGIDRDESGDITGLTLILDGTRLFTYERN